MSSGKITYITFKDGVLRDEETGQNVMFNLRETCPKSSPCMGLGAFSYTGRSHLINSMNAMRECQHMANAAATLDPKRTYWCKELDHDDEDTTHVNMFRADK